MISNAKHLSYLLLLLILTPHPPATAQPFTTTRDHPYEIYIEQRIDETGLDRLIFVDMLTGEQTSLEVYGQRYTPVGRSVMFSEDFTNRVLLASPDGMLREHPFIQPGSQTRRIDWVVSEDGRQLAWTLTNGAVSASLSTITTVANIDGTSPRQILVDGPRDGFRALPMFLDSTRGILYMDMHPDGLGQFTPFSQYAEVFAIDLATSTRNNLPAEPPGCFCGAGINAGLFFRLVVSSDLDGFDVRTYDLRNETAGSTIDALRLTGFTQAGDVLISPDGTLAVYALAQVSNFGAPDQQIRTVFVLADLQSRTQRNLTDPTNNFVHPIAWTEDNSAILFISDTQDGTWKATLSDGRLRQIADTTYIGRIHP